MLIDNFFALSPDAEVLLDMCYLAAATAYMDFSVNSEGVLDSVLDTPDKQQHATSLKAFLADIAGPNYCWPTMIRHFSSQTSPLENDLIGFEITQTNPFFEQITNETDAFRWDIVDRKTDAVLDALDTSLSNGGVNTAIENVAHQVKEESKTSYLKAGEIVTSSAGYFLEGFGVPGAGSLGEWGTEKFLNRKANSLDYEIAAAIYAAAIASDLNDTQISSTIRAQWREIVLTQGKKNNPNAKKTADCFAAGIKVLGEILGSVEVDDLDETVPDLCKLKLDKAITICESLDIALQYLDVRSTHSHQTARSIMMTENWTVKRQEPSAGTKFGKRAKIKVFVDK